MSRLSPNYSSWVIKDFWPRDPKGNIFLGRAVEFLATKTFGDNWCLELACMERPNIWIKHTPEARAKLALFAIRNSIRIDGYVLPNDDIFLGEQDLMSIVSNECFTDEDLDRIEDFDKKIHFHKLQFKSIAEKIAGWVADGYLRYATREVDGGLIIDGEDLGIWNTERNLGFFFNNCKIKKFIGYDNDCVDVYEDYFVFVEKDKFYGLCQESGYDNKIEMNDVYLSPYLKLMIFLAKKLNINSENQPKKAVVVSQIQAHWPIGVAQSSNLIEAMATLLRDPESQLGRARKPRLPPDSLG